MTAATDRAPRCRSCHGDRLRPFLSLGKHPLPDALVRPDQVDEVEPRYPLDVAFCEDCSLVQLLGEVPPEMLFVDNYLYFSSYSDHLLAHARRHALELIERRGLGPESLVIELASNDGYLLRNFVDAGIPVLGIDPAPTQAQAARAIGVPTIEEFFGVELAERLVADGRRADVVIANNVMAHIPDLNGFMAGMATVLADDGVVTVENPYVRDLIEHGEFDTIYHEHFFYHSCTGVDGLARRHGLHLNDVAYFPDLHGGTLRWYLGKRDEPSRAVRAHLADERARGMTSFRYYADFAERVHSIKVELLELLEDLKGRGSTIAAYGAAAKGSTLINYVGLGPELIDFVVDRNPHKHGLLMPGVHLPILPTDALLDRRPDHVLILAWNFADEIVAQQQEYLSRGGRFIVPVPRPEVIA